MKIKRFNESLNEGNPEVGDYVICLNISKNGSKYYVDNSKFANYLNNTIGKIYSINYDNYSINDDRYLIEYDNYPGWGERESKSKRYFDVTYWSKNKSELEYILQTNKFNL